ncbi:hypothetical protein [Bradyrhizobium sp. USDA 10063]
MLTATSGERHAQAEPPFEPDQVTKFDWSRRLSLDLIRQHTKTDDVPGVTDDQLDLYRASSVESAEFYTGMLLAGQRTVVEAIQSPPRHERQSIWPSLHPGKLTYRFRLQYPVADGMVYLYGGAPGNNMAFPVPPGTRAIRIPIRTGLLDLSNCCDPCATHYLNRGMMAAYKAGFACVDDVPAGIIVGCLQYIAWIIEHPGDELLTQRNRKDNSTKIGGVSGSNNIAMVSGALESWRLYDNEAI